MSRTIKYRVWDNENKSYNDPYSYAYYAMTQDGGLDFYCHGDHMDEADPDVYFIEQYTGLKDKNGKEIYEGDIITEKYRGFPDGKFCKKGPVIIIDYWLVEYDEKRAGFHPFCDCDDNGEYLYEEHMPKKHLEVEVIGNIHENPELLGGEE